MADDEQTSGEPKISESTAGVAIVSWLLFPLGLYWIWKHPTWSTGRKQKWTAAVAVWGIALVISGATGDGKQDSPNDGAASVGLDTSNTKGGLPLDAKDSERLDEAISTRFFSVRPGHDYIYESSSIIPGVDISDISSRIRRHDADGAVALIIGGSENRKAQYRVSQGSLEMVIGVESDNGPDIWGRLIPNLVKEGDRWQVKNLSSKTTWVCKRLSQWQDPPDQFADYAGNALAEIGMEKSVDGMDGPYEAYSYTFVEELGLVSFKYYVPTTDSAKGQVSLIRTERLIRIVASPSK